MNTGHLLIVFENPVFGFEEIQVRKKIREEDSGSPDLRTLALLWLSRLLLYRG